MLSTTILRRIHGSRWAPKRIPSLGGLLATLLAVGAPSRAPASELEYQVKAEFMERFTRFIDWPEVSFPAPDAPFVFCIVGEASFGDYLERMAAERKAKGRPIVVRRMAFPSSPEGCHLLFIAQSEQKRLEEILSHVVGKPILTVGDTSGFASAGVMINFFVERGFVRFEINMSAAREAGLKFSSKLLKLGRIVTTESEP
ncbi:DUF4154 domain-containing protein [Vitiosangium sp. GDMCC 1.1324]|nr:DUF4154 domain-containing protein [Vitiosangium sp. GDMCC 1.1324]